MANAEFWAEAEALLGARLGRTQADCEAHGRSETWFALTPPEAVAYPESTAEVSALMRLCTAHRVPVVGWGAGTSLEGHGLALHGGVVVDFARMNRVLDIRPDDRLVRVEPGLTREALNVELRASGLFFPVDPGANASLGGMAATRASGTTTVRYGSMRDNVAGLIVVLADGRVIHTGSGAAKSASGYDLTALMLGSEGTLGLITELTLRLHAQPEAISSAVCAFDDFRTAVECVQLVIQMGIPMARIEFVDAEIAKVFNKINGTSMPEKPHLLIEFHGSEGGVAEDSRRFGEVVAELGGADFQWATTTEERNRLWKMRHGAYSSCIASRPGCMGLVTDVCVPISRLAEAVARGREMIDAAALDGPILGHVGDGNFHAILLLDRANPDELTRAKQVAHDLAEMALDMGGTITGEHGIGMGKRGMMEAEHGLAWQVMGQIKQVLDPLGLLNPGKLVPEPEQKP